MTTGEATLALVDDPGAAWPRVAVVTNAGRYAGPGAVPALLKAGFTVLCHDEDFADETRRAAFESAHPGAVACKHRTPGRTITQAVREHGRIDLLVSNDTYPLHYRPVDESDTGDLRQAAESLLVTPIDLVARAAEHMKRQGSGHIVLITSAAPDAAQPGFAVYSSLRAGASAFAQAAARELAPYKITVHAIAPNFLESELYYPEEIWDTDEGRDRLKALVPAGRLGTKQEIGELIVFLSGCSACFLTGDVIKFTGGWP
ncbi:SDR family oxidoreductase [Streptomyces monticola]|uniref:SDR family oxidoreductase n=1 Tax=Streptomyces monticola TaxID=2666263 RepID=A0ABW2JYX4_9ACTN